MCIEVQSLAQIYSITNNLSLSQANKYLFVLDIFVRILLYVLGCCFITRFVSFETFYLFMYFFHSFILFFVKINFHLQEGLYFPHKYGKS